MYGILLHGVLSGVNDKYSSPTECLGGCRVLQGSRPATMGAGVQTLRQDCQMVQESCMVPTPQTWLSQEQDDIGASTEPPVLNAPAT